jgi:uncharacterized protein (DUF2147 family)
MKAIMFHMILAGLFLPLSQSFAQQVSPDDILGTWLNEDKDAHVEVYRHEGKYYGKIVWLRFPNDEETGLPKVDDENPDEELQQRPLMGLLLLKDFVFDEDEWNKGSIYDPNNGKTYDCYMELKNMDLLRIRGYIGISLIGRTTYWTRVKGNNGSGS